MVPEKLKRCALGKLDSEEQAQCRETTQRTVFRLEKRRIHHCASKDRRSPAPARIAEREEGVREDLMEKLDAMFPDGYLIVYTCPDSQLRLSLYNPHKDETIEQYHQTLKEAKR